MGRRSSGVALLVISFGILGVLAASSYIRYQAVTQQNRQAIQKVNAVEGFYGGEVALWNGYFRAQANSSLSGRFPASVDNQYDSAVTLTADAYDPNLYVLGQPFNLQRTKEYDSARTVIRRYGPDNLEYTVASGSVRTYCGIMKFPPSTLLNGACVSELRYQIPTMLTCLYLYSATTSDKDWYGVVAAQAGTIGAYRVHCTHCDGDHSNHEKTGEVTAQFVVNGTTYQLGQSIPADPNAPIDGRLQFDFNKGTVREAAQIVDIRRYFGVGIPVKFSNAYSPARMGVKDCRALYEPASGLGHSKNASAHAINNPYAMFDRWTPFDSGCKKGANRVGTKWNCSNPAVRCP